MKHSIILLLLVLVASAGHSNDDNDEKRLEAFLSKVENYYKKKELETTNWTMPNANPESNMDQMPRGNLQGSMSSHDSSLKYFPSTGKIFDSELNIELDTVTGIIYDFKTQKEYSLSDLQAQRNKR